MTAWPQWEVRGHGTAAGPLQPWFNVRLTFGEGSSIDVLAAAGESGISIEDLRAQPPLPLGGFAALAEWLQGPLEEACRAVIAAPVPAAPTPAGQRTPAGQQTPAGQRTVTEEQEHRGTEDSAGQPAESPPDTDESRDDAAPAEGRARHAQPRGQDPRLLAAEAYRAARDEGDDPVLAVMRATGRSRRRSLRLIAAARDAGHLPPRHNRR
ncbi:DUF6214 family protein [Streptomyces sp. NPDC050418]|uniref:DUF6214 family protein n=1 Tax=Streptomyces sp. NPDC050418 TaxID=3365612 RepID=UPI0037886707